MHQLMGIFRKERRKICYLFLFIGTFAFLFFIKQAFSSGENKVLIARSGLIKARIKSDDHQLPIPDDNGNNNDNDNSMQNQNQDDAGQVPPSPEASDGQGNNNDNLSVVPDFTISCPERVRSGEEFEVSATITGEETQGMKFFWDKGSEESENFKEEGEKVVLKYIKPGNYTVVSKLEKGSDNFKKQECQVDVSNPELSGQVKISAVLPNPEGVDNAPMPGGEIVWLYNDSQTYVDLSGWVIYDTDDTHELFLTLANVISKEGLLIGPKEKIAVFRNGDADFSLNNEGDKVRLFSGPMEMMGKLQDEVTYPGMKEGEEYAFDLSSLSIQNYPEAENSEKNIWETLPMKINIAFASEISDIIANGFEGFDFGEENWPLGDLRERNFNLVNKGVTRKDVFLSIADLAFFDSNSSLNDLKYWLVSLKNKDRCLVGCEGNFSLLNLKDHEEPLFQLEPGEKRDLIISLSLDDNIPPENRGNGLEFSFELLGRDESESIENENINAEAELINSNKNTDISYREGNINNNININSTPEEKVTQSTLVKPDNLEEKKKKANNDQKKAKKKKEESKKKKSVSSKSNIGENNLASKKVDLGNVKDESFVGEVESEQKDFGKIEDKEQTFLASTKQQATPLSWWRTIMGSGFLLKMFFLWIGLWSCLFWALYRRRAKE